MAIKQLSKAIGLAAMAMSGAVLADAPTLKEVLDASGITATGYVDAAYTHYDVDQSLQPGVLINPVDANSNTFSLKQASVTIASQPKVGFGAVATVIAGNDAKILNGSQNYAGASSDTNQFDITQGFVQYSTGPDNVLGSGLTLVGGKFFTLMGAEVVAPTGNTNISRSIAFLNAIPFTDTGVRLAYTPIDSLTLYAGAINSAGGLFQDDNSQKTFQLGFAWSPVPMFSWAATADNGSEGSTGNKNLLIVDTVVTVKPTDSLSLVLNYDYGKADEVLANGDDAKWDAIVGYINYQFSSEWRVSVRGEQFDDKDGVRLGLADLTTGDLSKKTTEYTLTVGYAPTEHFELRGEVRQDNTDKKAIVDGNKATDSQVFLAVEGLFKF